MSAVLTVLIDNQICGVISRTSSGRLRFEYEDSYREGIQRTPLSVSMPTQVQSHPDQVITPWMWGLLPDNVAVLQRWARQFHTSAASPFSMLSTPVGEDCPGAVRFVRPDDLDRVMSRTGETTWLSEEDVAQRLRELREDATAWLGRGFTGRFSLAGAQAKTALRYRDGKWGVPSGAIPTTHILKPAVTGLDDHDLNEHLCLDAARRCGLIVARTRVENFAGESAIVVERYDRVERDGVLRRVHQEDFCQALGVLPTSKYQSEGGPSPLDIVRMIRNVMPPKSADQAVERFVDALIWNWVIGGTDAHAKNYSLLLSQNQVRLAPLYDVASGLPYAHERELKLAMKIGGDYRVYPFHNAWPHAARELGIDSLRLRDRVEFLLRAAPDAFRDAAAQADVKALGRKLTERLPDLIADRAARCMRLIS